MVGSNALYTATRIEITAEMMSVMTEGMETLTCLL